MSVQSYSLDSYSHSRMTQEILKFSPLAPAISLFASGIHLIKFKVRHNKEEKLFEAAPYSSYYKITLDDLKNRQFTLLSEMSNERRRSSREKAAEMSNIYQVESNVINVLNSQIIAFESLLEKQFAQKDGIVAFTSFALEDEYIDLCVCLDMKKETVQDLQSGIQNCQNSLVKLHEVYKQSALTFEDFSLHNKTDIENLKVKMQNIKSEISSSQKMIAKKKDDYDVHMRKKAEFEAITKIINLKQQQKYHKHQAKTWLAGTVWPVSIPAIAYMNRQASLKESKLKFELQGKILVHSQSQQSRLEELSIEVV